jgi:hypothetical protein
MRSGADGRDRGAVLMTIVNDSTLQAFLELQLPMLDNLMATAQASSFLQGSTVCLRSQINRFTSVASTGTAVLPQMATGEADPFIVVVNDGANSMNVYPFVGEKQNGATSAFGATTAALAVPAGQSAVFVMGRGVKKGGVATALPLEWKSGLLAA